jgi:hypothetical protein
MYLLEEEIEHSLLEELVSDQSSFTEESDLSGTDDLTVGEIIGAECCDVQFSAASSGALCFECYIYVGGHDKLCRAKGTVWW